MGLFSDIFGGGGSSASVTQNINNSTVTDNDLKAFSEQVTQNVINSIISTSQKSNANIIEQQSQMFGPLYATGYGQININNINKQSAKISLTSVQNSLTTSNLSQLIAQNMASQIKNSTNAATFNKLVSNAESKMSSGVLSGILDIGSGGSSADSNTNVTTNITIEQETKLTNIIRNIAQTNSNISNVKTCFSNMYQSQSEIFKGAYASGHAIINITNNNTQISSNIAKCLQSGDIVKNIAQNLIQKMGLKYVGDVKASNKTIAKNTAKSTDIKKGLGSLISSILGFFKGTFGMILGFIIIIVCLILSGCSIYSLSRSHSKKNLDQNVQIPSQDNQSQNYGDNQLQNDGDNQSNGTQPTGNPSNDNPSNDDQSTDNPSNGTQPTDNPSNGTQPTDNPSNGNLSNGGRFQTMGDLSTHVRTLGTTFMTHINHLLPKHFK